MKKVHRWILLTAQFILVPLFISGVFADPPGPPGPGGDPSGGGTAVGAPIDNGVIVLFLLGMSYGCYKLYEVWRKKNMVKAGEQV